MAPGLGLAKSRKAAWTRHDAAGWLVKAATMAWASVYVWIAQGNENSVPKVAKAAGGLQPPQPHAQTAQNCACRCHRACTGTDRRPHPSIATKILRPSSKRSPSLTKASERSALPDMACTRSATSVIADRRPLSQRRGGLSSARQQRQVSVRAGLVETLIRPVLQIGEVRGCRAGVAPHTPGRRHRRSSFRAWVGDHYLLLHRCLSPYAAAATEGRHCQLLR